MPNSLSPNNTGIAPVFSKSVTYSLKKNSFRDSKASFDSSKNIYLFFMFIYYLKDDVMSYLFPESNKEDTANNIEETETKSDITEEITSENMNKE